VSLHTSLLRRRSLLLRARNKKRVRTLCPRGRARGLSQSPCASPSLQCPRPYLLVLHGPFRLFECKLLMRHTDATPPSSRSVVSKDVPHSREPLENSGHEVGSVIRGGARWKLDVDQWISGGGGVVRVYQMLQIHEHTARVSSHHRVLFFVHARQNSYVSHPVPVIFHEEAPSCKTTRVFLRGDPPPSTLNPGM